MLELQEWPFQDSWNGPCRFIKGEDSDYISGKSEPSIFRFFPNADLMEMLGTYKKIT